jgi:phosphatidylinositol-3-phosphatase
MKTTAVAALVATSLGSMVACAPTNPGVPGSPALTEPAIDGTVFTIILENENVENVLVPSAPYIYGLSQTYGRADAYISNVHPSLANYIQLTSGQVYGINSSGDPAANVPISDADNLAEQLETAGIPWRAYMESMGEPCNAQSSDPYGANHNPFVYYQSLTNDPARCAERVVDFDQHFAEDLAADRYEFMWITPNRCNDMHDCPVQVADAWLARVVPQIMSSPGYLRGGVIFILTDEGHLRIGRAAANLATIVISPRLVSPNYVSQTTFGHNSYLATIEDIFGLPRLPTTVNSTPMSEFFVTRSSTLP